MEEKKVIIETLEVSGKVDNVIPKVAKGKGTIKIVVIVPYNHETWVSLGNVIGQDAKMKIEAYAAEERLSPDEAAKRDTPMLGFDDGAESRQEDSEPDDGTAEDSILEDAGEVGTAPGVPPKIKAADVPSAGYGENGRWPGEVE